MQGLIKLVYDVLTIVPDVDIETANYIAKYLINDVVKIGEYE